MKKIILAIFSALYAALSAWSVNHTSLYRDKAQRAFEQQEWATASAMYDLAIDEGCNDSNTLAHAIVTAAMRNDSVAQLSLLDKSLASHIAFDSTFTAVRRVSFSIANDTLYHGFLLLVQRHRDWLVRAIDAYLLDYHDYRNNPGEIIRYSRRMLDRLPDNIHFLGTLGKGLMLDGQTDEAIATYERILQLDPDDYNALLQLGIYHALSADETVSRQKATHYLQRAYSLHPTPHVARLIGQLTATRQESGNK